MMQTSGSEYDFTESEIRTQLEKLGYYNIPDHRLKEFKRDLDQVLKHEKSSIEAAAGRNSTSPTSSTTRHSPSFMQSQLYRYSDVTSSSLDQSKDKENRDVHIQVMGVDPSTRKQPMYSYYDSDDIHPRSAPVSPAKSTVSTDTDGERRQIKRKVLRKINGESRIDESIVESDVDVSALHDRMRQLPIDEDDMMSETSSDDARVAGSKWAARPMSAQELRETRWSYDDTSQKSVIYPMAVQPHQRNVRRCDPVSRYHQFRQCWDAQKAPGEKQHKSLRWNLREHMLYKDEVVKKAPKNYVPNNYVVPTEKKRKSLRWRIRADLAAGLMPSSRSGYTSS